ncbi:MAG: Ig-like domain-containing protein [Bacteroidales bacterium]|nr:Ig-like domain-containing protein [Bacteroidales bacterium]
MIKRKRLYGLFALFFAVVVALTCAFTLSACGEKDEKDDGVATHSHDYVLDDSTWAWTDESHTSATATETCTNADGLCDALTITVSADRVETANSATCTEAGKITHTAYLGDAPVLTCDSEDSEKLGHAYTVTFTWGENEETGEITATANYTCANDPEHHGTKEATVSETDEDGYCTASVTLDDEVLYTSDPYKPGSAAEENPGANPGQEEGDKYTVTIENTETKIATGDTITLSAYVSVDGVKNDSLSVTWSASPTGLVTIEGNTLTAGSAVGDVTVTASYKYGDDEGDVATGTITISIEEHTHSISGNVSWSWTGSDEEGYTSATVTFTCEAEGCVWTEGKYSVTYVLTEDDVVTQAPTCGATGSTTYTASVTYGGQDYTDSKVVAIAPTGEHTYSQNSAVTWSAWTYDNTSKTYSVTAAVACDVCYQTVEANATVNAENPNSGETLSCTVTIGEGEAARTYTGTYTPDVYTITIAVPAGDILDETSVELTATVQQGNATVASPSITWAVTSGNEYAAIEADTGILTCEAAGAVTVSATITASDGRLITQTRDITIQWNNWRKAITLDFSDYDTYSWFGQGDIGHADAEGNTSNESAGFYASTEGGLTDGTTLTYMGGSSFSFIRYELGTGYYLRTPAGSYTTDSNYYIKIDTSTISGSTVKIDIEWKANPNDDTTQGGTPAIYLRAGSATGTQLASATAQVNGTMTTLEYTSIGALNQDTLYIAWQLGVDIASVYVRVFDDQSEEVYTVTIDSSESWLTVGDEISLGASVYRNNVKNSALAVEWSYTSADGGVVELDTATGYLKATAAGTVTITATYTYGQETATDTITITIIENKWTDVVDIDFADPDTYTWLTTEIPSSVGNHTDIITSTSTEKTKTDPYGVLSITLATTTDSWGLYYLDNSGYSGLEDTYVLRTGTVSTGSYFEIDLSQLSDMYVEISLVGESYSNASTLTLTTEITAGTTVDGTSVLASLSTTRGTPGTLYWAGTINDDWTKLYIISNTQRSNIYSINIRAYGEVDLQEQEDPALSDIYQIAIDSSVTEILVDDSVTLGCTITKNGSQYTDEVVLSWTTSDSGVLMVTADTGDITGVSAGTATITVTFAWADGQKSTSASVGIAVVADTTEYTTVVNFGDTETTGKFGDLTIGSYETGATSWSNVQLSGEVTYHYTCTSSFATTSDYPSIGSGALKTASQSTYSKDYISIDLSSYIGAEVKISVVFAGTSTGDNNKHVALDTVQESVASNATSTMLAFASTHGTGKTTLTWSTDDLDTANALLYLGFSGSVRIYSVKIYSSVIPTDTDYTIEITEQSVEVEAGTTTTLTATVYADGTAVADAVVTWSSANESVATVDSATGEVTGVAAGSTTIWATYTYEGGSVAAYVTVTVSVGSAGIRIDFSDSSIYSTFGIGDDGIFTNGQSAGQGYSAYDGLITIYSYNGSSSSYGNNVVKIQDGALYSDRATPMQKQGDIVINPDSYKSENQYISISVEFASPTSSEISIMFGVNYSNSANHNNALVSCTNTTGTRGTYEFVADLQSGNFSNLTNGGIFLCWSGAIYIYSIEIKFGNDFETEDADLAYTAASAVEVMGFDAAHVAVDARVDLFDNRFLKK